MNRGLVYLLRKKPVGWVRLVSRRFTGAKRVFVVLGIGALLAVVVGPQVFLSIQTQGDIGSPVESLRLWGPPALMLLALMGASSGAGLSFRPSEVDFLFPAPIGRRELLLYHVLGRLLTGLLSSLWLAIFVLRWAPHWYWGLVGILFASFFLMLSSELATVLLATVSARATRLVKSVAWLGLAVLLVVGVVVARQQLAGASLMDAARQVAGSTPVVVVSAPARVFVEVYASQSLAQFAGWGAASLGLLLLLFGLLVGLDLAYTDAALRASRRVQDRLRRMRAGGSAMAAAAPGKPRFSLPVLPWCRGAGPLAWRQGIEAMRSLRAILITGAMIIGFPLLIVLMPSALGSGRSAATVEALESTHPLAFIMVLVMSLFTTQNLALDFRRDVDRMAYLKSLPLAPSAVALGQIVPAIVVLVVLQGLAFAAIILIGGARMPWPSFLLVLVPFNWLAVGLDNVLFLLFPYRFAPAEAGQFRFMGRAMLTMSAKMVALMFGAGGAALAGLLFYSISGSLPYAAVGAAVMLVGEAVVVTRILGRVFGSYDVNKDVAG